MIKLKDILNEDISKEIEMLKKYIKAGGERSTNIDSTIESLYKKKSSYPKELKPKSGEVYRGTVVDTKMLKKMKPSKVEERYLYYNIPYKSRRGVQSFTYDEFIARKFSEFNASSQNKTPAIIVAKVDNSFVGNPSWLYKVGKEVGLSKNEKETFHVGNKINAILRVDDLMGVIYPR
jgi:hypothetical protein